jgi:hypothetical protein
MELKVTESNLINEINNLMDEENEINWFIQLKIQCLASERVSDLFSS